MLAGEVAARLVGIDDARGIGESIAGQVMIGHQHAHAEAVRLRHAFHRGDAVVHRDQDVGLASAAICTISGVSP